MLVGFALPQPAAAQAAPDLTVDIVDFTSSHPLLEDGSFTIGATVTNEGNGASDATTLTFYRSANATITTGDTSIATDSVDILAASGSSTHQATGQWPSPGTYYFGACVSTVSGETDTNNNCSTGVMAIVDPPPVPPEITTQPMDQSVMFGESVTFTVVASGTPPLRYRWHRNGNRLAGATRATYTIDSATNTHGGQYTVVVTNFAGSVTSREATLTVPAAVAPEITTQPMDQSVTVGESATFTVAASGAPTPTYQWRKDRIAIAGATSATYTLASTSYTDRGQYSVVVTNPAGVVNSTSALLAVTPAPGSAPEILTQPTNQSVTVGGSATFTMEAAGTLPLEYRWFKNGILFRSSRISGGRATHSISNARVTDVGVYTVRVVNRFGAVTSTAATLTVTGAAPDLTVDDFTVSSTSVVEGAPFTVGATVNNRGNAASAAATLTYSHQTTHFINTINSTPIGTDPVSVLAAGGSSTQNASVSIATAGTYWLGACLAKNNCSNGVQVVVTALPTPDLTVDSVSVPSASVVEGASFTIDATVNNGGSGASAATTLTYILSTDSRIHGRGGSDTAIGTDPVSVLAAGGSSTQNTSVSIATAGTYWIGACVAAVPGEANLNNNCSTGVRVAVTLDLTVDGVTVSSASVVAGDSFTITATVNNGGGGASAATTLTYYRSTDSTIAAGDTSIATDPVGILAANGSSTQNASVSIATAGTYWVGACIRDQTQGTDNCSTAVQVAVTPAAVAPTIGTQPANQSITVGEAATFTVVAFGSAPTYQWRKDGTAIPGATSATYIISSVTSTDAGSYSVVATNSAGAVTSNAATLTVVAIAPAITTQPTNQSVTVGDSATFTVAASGTPTPTYQWRKDGTAIPGATSATYTIDSTTFTNAGSYSVVATNSVGTVTSNAATLTVAGIAPAITTQPTKQYATAGGSVTFTVAASGTPTPTYQWRKDGTAIPGATSATYIISSAALTDAGSYSVVATNSAGAVTSAAATLTVTAAAAPTITTQPTNQSVTVGDSATFTVAASGTPTPTYQWHKDGTAIDGANSATYTIDSTTLTDAESYTVVATNSAGAVTSTAATLTVAGIVPEITTRPYDQSVSVGDSATFTVVASGTPTPTYQWRKDGTAIDGANSATYTIDTTTLADSGLYRVVATNSAGAVISTAAILTVTGISPRFTTEPVAQFVAIGERVTFTALASGTPTPTYQWLKNRVAIAGATSATYIIDSMTLADVGGYSVIATNSVGRSTTRNALLTVTTENGAPEITLEPEDRSLMVGETMNFTVAAAGTTPLTYQWFKDGVAVEGRIYQNFRFTAALAHAGQYSVEVTNEDGSDTSRTATLTVTPAVAPAITTQPTNQSVAVGDDATFTVAATGTPLNYQWRKNGRLTRQQSATLTISNANGADAGSYLAMVHNAAGSVTSTTVTLTVTPPVVAPEITTQPVNQSVTVGESATFTVAAYGTPTYQWHKDGTAIARATSAAYTIDTTTLADAGSYTVVATNSAGDGTSAPATLSVAGIVPEITTQPTNQSATVGGSATFTVAASGTPTPTYQWRKDGTAISGATSATYTLSGAALTDAGSYSVVATNSAGAVTSNAATLTVAAAAVAPEITTQPTNQSVTVGENATFTVAATGTPTPTYQWRFEGSDISGATSASYTLSNAALTNAGDYTVVVTNTAGTVTSSAATLTVTAAAVAPQITTQPTDQSVTVGENATFTVAATGTPTPTYQWRFEGSDISGATSASYTLSNAALTNAGDYTVVVTNTAGTVTSSAATLTVTAAAVAPQITTQPTDQSVTVGENATFTVAATGTPTPTYQWRFEGSDISGATSASYTLSNAALTNAGDYTVVVTNTAGTVTSSAATLTVTAAAVAPQITTQPTDQSVTVGENATFTVAATGTPTPTYQWRFEGSDISGATSASYTLSNAALTNAGDYTVVVTNTAGTVTSSAATLTVTAAAVAPQITTQPTDQSVTVGENATFTVTATGTPTPTYQWRFEGSDISGATSASYTLSSAALTNAGDYTVVVTNTAGTVTSSAATLTVTAAAVAPQITTQPTDQSVTVGENATFTVAATGTPTPTYQWRFEGSDISGATSASYTLSNAALTNAGDYTVVVTNTAGTVTSSAATLTVTAAAVAPQITTQPTDQSVTVGENATFTVAATGTPTPTYQWRFEGSDISGATSASYTLSNAALTNAGDYTVVVTNTAGTVTSSAATLTVTAAAVAPQITTQPTDQSVTVGENATFTVAATGTPTPTYQWRFEGSDISGATSASYTLSNAALTNAGDYTVVVTNTAGTVTSTAATLTVTAAAAPSVDISIANGLAAEGNDISFAVTLGAQLLDARTLNVTYAGVTADLDADLGTRPTTLALPTGTTTVNLVVPTFEDRLAEPNETFTVTLSVPEPLPDDPMNTLTITTATATGTIGDDDSANITIDDQTKAENEDFRIGITTSGARNSEPVNITWTVTSGTTNGGSVDDDLDLSASTGSITLPASVGENRAEVFLDIPIDDDDINENNETFTLALTANGTAPRGVFFGTSSSAVLTITDNDDPTAAPDLTVDSVSVSSASVVEGISFTISATVNNGGNAASAATTLTYYRSADATITTGDTSIGADVVDALAANGSSPETEAVSIATAGTYYVGACVPMVSDETNTTNNCSTGVQVTVTAAPPTAAPDLTVDSVSVSSASVVEGASFTINAIVNNEGDRASALTTLTWYRSADATITTDDTSMATDTVQILLANGRSLENAQVSIATAGTYWVGACVPAVSGESNTDNNCSTGVQVTVTAPAAPDLTVDGVTVSSASVVEGASFTINATVNNEGNAASAATTLTWYRSADATITTGDTSMATDPVGILAANGSSTQNASVSIATADTYYVGACVPAASGETDTDNNCSTGVQVTVTAPAAPDLTVDGVTVSSASVVEGASFTINATVNNEGNAASAATTLTYYRSADATITTGDTSIGTDSVGALAASGSSPQNISVSIATADTYHVGACVPAVSGETDTDNNCSTGVQVTVTPAAPSGPDLTVGSVTVSSASVVEDVAFTINATVNNEGNAASAATTLTYYRSADATITTGDTSIGTDSVGALAASGSSPQNISVSIATADTYHVGACVPAVSGETDTDNNCSTGVQVTVTPAAPSGPDLTVGSVTVSSASVVEDVAFTINATVNNEGNAASAATTLTYYRSADATITTGDTSIGTDSVGALAASGSSPQNISVSIATADTYHVGACVPTVSGETNTDNNCSTGVQVTVTPAAVAPAITTQPTDQSVTVGGTATFTVTATGTPTPTYQWRFDGTEISGATSASYAISSAALTNAGDYTVVVTNTAGAVTSNAATLTVTAAAPDLTVGSVSVSSASVVAGASFTINATVNNGGSGASAATTLTYYRSADATITTGDTSIATDAVGILAANGSSPETASVSIATAGTYHVGACVPTVSGETDTDNNCSTGVQVTVTPAAVAPEITTQPTNQSVTVGGSATFTVAASGSPTPTYQWRKDGTAIAGATSATYAISGAASTDAGSYSVVATNTAGAVTSNAATLTVTAAAPDLTVGSVSVSSASVVAGASFTINATVNNGGSGASAATTLTYYRSADATITTGDTSIATDAVGILAANGSSPETASVSIATAGTYYVGACVPTVSSETNTDNNCSTGVQVTVTLAAVAPAITTQPTNQSVTVGGSATFTVAASGAPTPAYQWRKDGAAIAGATSATYAISGAALTDAGSYSVVATNSAGAVTSNAATLTVTAAAVAPAITTQPTNQAVTVGGSATFTVAASGSPTPAYQWRKDGNAIAGATSATYAISGAALTDAGSYTVVATNSAGAVTSNAATLTVTAAAIAPAITTQPTNQAVTVGGSATFTVAASGSPTPAYQWRKDGNAIAGATSATYAISGAALTDAGSYTVVATNSAGAVTSNAATLTVTAAAVAPAITTQPTNQAVTVGGSATFTVAASGAPTPAYQWRKDGSDIAGATSATYAIANAALTDAGSYTVVATNSAGTVTSTAATLTVTPAAVAPAITTQPVNQSVTVGGSATFTVAASGTPTPAYQWRKDGTAIAGATSATYSISRAALTDSGSYSVVATNSAGSDTSRNATLTVTAAAPDLTVDSVSVSSASVVAGASFTINATVNNEGNAASAATTLTYYRSANATITTGDTSIAIDPVGILAASGSSAQTASVSIATADTYYVGACVPTVSGETNTTNNCSTGVQVTVTAPAAPDLTVDSVSVSSASVVAGASFTIAATVNNEGNTASAATTLTYYRSADATITTGDTSIAIDPVGILAASGSSAQTASVSIATAGTYYVGACVPTVSGETNTDNNCSTGVQVTVTAVTATVSIDDTSVAENGGNAAFTVRLTTAVDSAVTLAVTYAADTATLADDLGSGRPTTVTIDQNQTSATLLVPVTNDNIVEGNEDFTVTISEYTTPLPVGVIIGTNNEATGTITDDDTAEVTLSPPTATAAENGTFTYTVSLSAPADEAVTVRWTASAESATVADDLRSTTGTVTFPADTTAAQTFAIAVADDDIVEENETFTVTLSAVGTLPDGVTIDEGNATSTATITDNDTPASVSIADASAAENAGNVTFAVTLSEAVDSNVVLGIAYAAGSADLATDLRTGRPATVTIDANSTSATFRVPIVDDDVFEPDETFTVTLTGDNLPTGVVVGTATATGTIRNDDFTSVLAEPRRSVAMSALRRHTNRFERVTSNAAHSRLRGRSSTNNAGLSGGIGSGNVAKGFDFGEQWNGWLDGSFAGFHGDSSGRQVDLYAGADHLSASGKTVWGVMLGIESAQLDVGPADYDASHLLFGAYGGSLLTGTLIWDGAVSFSTATPDLSRQGISADYDARRFSIRSDLTGAVRTLLESGALTVAPQVGVTYVRESLGTFVDSAGSMGSREMLELGRISAGPRFTWRLDEMRELILRARLQWDMLSDDMDNNAELSAAVDVGARFNPTPQLAIGIYLEAHGLGNSDEYATYGGRFELRAAF